MASLRAPGLALLLSLAALAAPGAGEPLYDDPAGDADGGLDVDRVRLTFGNGTLGVEVRFVPGDLPAGRAVRGVVVLGQPGTDEPAEWYQVTIANETTVYVAHGDAPRQAELVSTSWTDGLASAQWRREDPAPPGGCAFAVVEAGTMDAAGFVRSDVAPRGFAAPEDAWPVEDCPGELIIEGPDIGEEKGSPGLPLLGLAAALAVALLVRRR